MDRSPSLREELYQKTEQRSLYTDEFDAHLRTELLLRPSASRLPLHLPPIQLVALKSSTNLESRVRTASRICHYSRTRILQNNQTSKLAPNPESCLLDKVEL